MDITQLLDIVGLTEESVTVIGVLLAWIVYLVLDTRRCNARNQRTQARIEEIEDRHAKMYQWMLESATGSKSEGRHDERP